MRHKQKISLPLLWQNVLLLVTSIYNKIVTRTNCKSCNFLCASAPETCADKTGRKYVHQQTLSYFTITLHAWSNFHHNTLGMSTVIVTALEWSNSPVELQVNILFHNSMSWELTEVDVIQCLSFSHHRLDKFMHYPLHWQAALDLTRYIES